MTNPDRRVSLVINLAPSDVGLCEHTVPHQIHQFGAEVDEVLLVVDGLNSRGRFGEGWLDKRKALEQWLAMQQGVRIIEVDYSLAACQRAAQLLGLDGMSCPHKDFRGGPYQAYFYGLVEASHARVLHADSDMLFGGSGRGWVNEALAVLDQPEVLCVSPLPGPPTVDGQLLSQSPVYWHRRLHHYGFSSFSTRVFLLDREQFASKLGAWTPSRPGLRGRARAWLDGRPAIQLPEIDISQRMAERSLWRVDLLGETAQRWSLHPPYRTTAFLKALPTLINQVMSDSLPAAQRGHHDVTDASFDWSEARAALRAKAWHRRLMSRST